MTRWQILQNDLYIDKKQEHMDYQEGCELESIVSYDLRYGFIRDMWITHMSYEDNQDLRSMNI